MVTTANQGCRDWMRCGDGGLMGLDLAQGRLVAVDQAAVVVVLHVAGSAAGGEQHGGGEERAFEHASGV